MMIEKHKAQETVVGELKEALALTHKEFKTAQARVAEKEAALLRSERDRAEEASKWKAEFQLLKQDKSGVEGEVENSSKVIIELKKLLNQANRDIYNLKAEIEHKDETIALVESRFAQFKETAAKQRVEAQQKLKEIEDVLRVKMIMLEDKSAEIESLKLKESQAKEETLRQAADFETKLKLADEDRENQKRSTRKLKDQLQSLQQELDSVQQSLEEKTAEAAELQAELEGGNLKAIEAQMSELEKRLQLASDRERESKSKIAELVELIDELRQKLTDRKRAFDALKSEFSDSNKEHKRALAEKDSQIQQLQKELEEALGDVKILVQEIENKKRQAQSNLTKLAQIFN